MAEIKYKQTQTEGSRRREADWNEWVARTVEYLDYSLFENTHNFYEASLCDSRYYSGGTNYSIDDYIDEDILTYIETSTASYDGFYDELYAFK